MAKKGRAATAALQALQDAKIDFAPVEYEHSASMEHGFALDIAEVLGLDPATIFKTLVAFVDGRPVCAVVPATSHLALKALAAVVGGKHAEMAAPKKAQHLTGYVVGGISPLGQRTQLPVNIDDSALEQGAILVSGGKRNLSVRVAPRDLAGVVGAEFASIAAAGHP